MLSHFLTGQLDQCLIPLGYFLSHSGGIALLTLGSAGLLHSWAVSFLGPPISSVSRALLRSGAGQGSCRGLNSLEEMSALSSGPAPSEFEGFPFILPAPPWYFWQGGGVGMAPPTRWGVVVPRCWVWREVTLPHYSPLMIFYYRQEDKAAIVLKTTF